MQVIGEYNNVSAKLFDELVKPLGYDETVWFKMLHGVENLDPEPPAHNESPKPKVLYGARQIPTQDRIKDPYKVVNGKEVGGFVNIGVPDRFNEAGQPIHTKCFVPGHGTGIFGLNGNSVEDVELYEYLMLSNHNQNNPYRDKRKDAMYRLYDEALDGKNETVLQSTKRGRKPKVKEAEAVA